MKKILSICLIIFFASCTREILVEKPVEEIATAKPIFDKNCFTVCNVNKNPDLTLVTNAEEDTLFADGIIDSSSYFWTKYHVRTHPVHLTQNYIVPQNYVIRYGWNLGDTVNMVRLQCLVENIAPFDSTCINDWEFNESQGYLSPLNNYFFDGLFEFETYELIGNRWKYISTSFKKEFFPSSIPNMDYVYNTNFCYYQRGIPAQMGDFYYNPFWFPNHDGIYKVILKFNPRIKGCRAIKETNYSNNEKTVILRIENGTVTIL